MRKKWTRQDYSLTEYDLGTENNLPSATNAAGAMTKKQQVMRLMAQGQVNRAWANSMFPHDAEVPDDFIPPDYVPDTMSLIDESRAILRGKNAGEARKEAADKQKLRGPADDIVAQHADADRATNDTIERVPTTPEP